MLGEGLSECLTPNSVKIERPSVDTSDGGFPVSGFAEVEASVSCSLQVSNGALRIRVQGLEKILDAYLFLAIDTDVQRNDRITDLDSGEVYRAMDVIDAAGRGHHLEVLLEREGRVSS